MPSSIQHNRDLGKDHVFHPAMGSSVGQHQTNTRNPRTATRLALYGRSRQDIGRVFTTKGDHTSEKRMRLPAPGISIAHSFLSLNEAGCPIAVLRGSAM